MKKCNLSNLHHRHVALFFACLLGLGVSACGQDEEQTQYEENLGSSGANTPVQKQRAANNAEFVSIPLQVKGRGSLALTDEIEGFALTADAATYSISLAGCLSGYTATATDTSGVMNVYKYDTGCLGKLTQFTLNGKTYSATADGASNFNSWAVGQTATFANATDSTDTFRVEVIAQLTSPVVAGDTIAYEFSQIRLGSTETVASAVVGDSHTLTVSGNTAPDFTITTVTMTGMGANGEGKFTFKLTCAVALSGTPNDFCRDVDMNDIEYKLIEDTTSSSLTYAQAATAMSSGTTAITLGSEKHATGNGGFTTAALTGPATIHSKPNLMLIIGVSNGSEVISFKYFNVDITTLSNN